MKRSQICKQGWNKRQWTTRSLIFGLCSATVLPIAAQDQNLSFGENELFDFNTFAQETRYGWSSGDALTTDLDLSTRIGKITGSKNKRISKAVKAWGVTIIPEIRADTRSGARLTSSLQATTGVELFAGLTVGGEGFNATLDAGPTLVAPQNATAGQFFELRGGSNLGIDSTFDPGLPKFDAGMDVILNGSFNNRFEYGLFPLAKYKVGNFGFDFDFDFNLFDFNFDLNLPELDINFPDLPNFEIPGTQPDNTLIRQKIPPSNPALSIAEIAVDNPLATISTDSGVTSDGRLTTSTSGSIARAGLDIDGVVSALTTGVSFTGTSVKVGPGKIGYDLIDVKYGVELGVKYDTEIDPFVNATLSFKDENGAAVTVLKKNDDGSTEEVTEFSGRWDELPEFATLSRDDVHVDVDFTDIEAIFSHSGALTLSDYMELQALKAKVSILPGVNLVNFGPLYYQKFPLAGEFADFEIFDASFSLGSIAVPDGVWDDSFIIAAAPIIDVALASGGASLTDASRWRELGSGATPTTLADKTLVIGLYGAGDRNRLDVTPIDYVDEGSVIDYTFKTIYFEGFFVRSRTATATRALPGVVTSIDGLVVGQGSSYRMDEGGSRRFSLNRVDNNGQISADGYLEFSTPFTDLQIEGSGAIQFDHPGKIAADTLRHGEGHTITFGNFDNAVLAQSGYELDDWPDVPHGDSLLGRQLNGSNIVITPGITSVATTHVFDVTNLYNAGTIAFGGNDFNLTFSQLENKEAGTIRVFDGRTLTLDSLANTLVRDSGTTVGRVLNNSGLIEATGANTQLVVSQEAVQSILPTEAPGEIVARDGATATFNNATGFRMTDATITAGNGGTVTFDTDVYLGFDATIKSEVGGTVNLNDGLTVPRASAIVNNSGSVANSTTTKEKGGGGTSDFGSLNLSFEIVNEGTLNINSFVDLKPFSKPSRDNPEPTLDPIGLDNPGTINIADNGELRFGALIRNYNGDGASLAEGTWNLNGVDGDFSNLSNSGGAIIDVDVLGYAVEDEVFFDILGGVARFNQSLQTNAATVRMNGRAYFRYFNTLEINKGTFIISGGHQFTTAFNQHYLNDGGTTTVQTGGDLFVRGALKVYGGEVTADATSTITAQTQTEPINEDETEFRDVTVEVIGGTLDIADGTYLGGTDMFTGLGSTAPGVENLALNSGQVWIVREQVAIDPVTEAETVTPAAINLGNVAITENDGIIVIDGEAASFDAAEAITTNRGTLGLLGGFEFNVASTQFTNEATGEIVMQSGSLVFDQPASVFQNDGTLLMDGDSYLAVDHFINGGVSGPGALVQLDGVLEANLVTINPGSTIAGSGQITGSIVNNGTLDLGNSPGRIETFGSYTQGSGAQATFEFEGYEPGDSFDQLVIRAVAPVQGEQAQPDLFVTLDGSLDLVFADDLLARRGAEWVLIDNQGAGDLIGGFDPADVAVTGLLLPAVQSVSSGEAVLEAAGDLYLGDLDYAELYLTYTGGDGNDLAIYSVVDSVLGDMDGDGAVTNADISAFVLALTDPAGYATSHPGLDPVELGDVSLDGVLNNGDIAGFVDLLRAQGITSGVPIPEPTSALLLAIGGLGLLRRRRQA